ncbi:metallophosphoesterase [Oribacterium sinus]|uniref:metallophosphoesterase n=1 Tax=Oribacterium sinus TaxID=237576 RepID=UPI0026EA43F4|nr:metallophosphoesterase [Oribacterium sinus]
MERYRISTDKVKKAYRFLFLTDLHDKSFGKDNALLLKKIEELKPRWIFIGGDFPISYSGEKTAERDEVENSCRLLYALAEKYPLYYAFGNHEEKLFSKEDFQGKQQAFRKALEKVELLENRSLRLEQDLELSGLSLDLSYYRPLLWKKKKPLGEEDKKNWEKAIEATGENRPKNIFRIALMHSPFYQAEMEALPVDLVLSGHFHGGAIGFPGFALMTPQYKFFVKNPRGLRKVGGQWHFTGRGLGTHSINVRLANFPELACFDILPMGEA